MHRTSWSKAVCKYYRKLDKSNWTIGVWTLEKVKRLLFYIVIIIFACLCFYAVTGGLM